MPFFAGFTPAELDNVAAVMIERVYRSGEIIFLERQPAAGLFFVASGRVRVFKTSKSGKEQALCLMSPRTCFGGCPIFDGHLSPVTAQAVDKVTVYLLPTAAAIALAENSLVLARALLRIFAGRLDHLTTIVDGLAFKCVTQRLAETLLAYAHDQGGDTDRGIEIELDLTQEKLASLVGCAREVVTRAILRLERLGAIEARGRHIIVLNRGKLSNIT
jgi:CRP/FNR family transcriptional regulator